MKTFIRVIQNKENHLFLKADGSWTEDREEAATFSTVKEVFDLQKSLPNVKLQMLIQTHLGDTIIDLE